jgi:hypothetical protein
MTDQQRAANWLLLDYIKRTRPWWTQTIAEMERRLGSDSSEVRT